MRSSRWAALALVAGLAGCSWSDPPWKRAEQQQDSEAEVREALATTAKNRQLYENWRYWAPRLSFEQPNCLINGLTEQYAEGLEIKRRGDELMKLKRSSCIVPSSLLPSSEGGSIFELTAGWGDLSDRTDRPPELQGYAVEYTLAEVGISCDTEQETRRPLFTLIALPQGSPLIIDLDGNSQAIRMLGVEDELNRRPVTFEQPLWLIKGSERYAVGTVRNPNTMKGIVEPICQRRQEIIDNAQQQLLGS